MIFKTCYPIASPKGLVFLNKGQEGIVLEFAQRLAAFFADHKKTGHITSGYRSVARQEELYAENCKQHPPNGNGFVAKPGNSWHNGRCAVDIADDGFWQAYMTEGDMHKTVKKQELYKYGLCLPLNYVDAATVFEWWHIQPVETIGYTGNRTKFVHVDDVLYDPEKDYLWDFEAALDYIADHSTIDPKYWITRREMDTNFDRLVVKFSKALYSAIKGVYYESD